MKYNYLCDLFNNVNLFKDIYLHESMQYILHLEFMIVF